VKITGVATRSFPSAAGFIVALQSDEGISGVGVSARAPHGNLERFVDEVLVGEDPRAVTGLWQQMLSAFARGVSGSLQSDVLAVLDVALWDLKAKSHDEPLWKTLGGSRPRVKTHAGACPSAASDAELARWYGTFVRDYGITGAKLRASQDRDADLRRIEMLQRLLEAHTAQPVLMMDADERWSPKESVGRMRELEERFDLTWVEAPAARWDFLGHKRVSDGIRSAVCAGGRLDTLGGFLPHLHHHALDVVQIDTGRVGITAALQVADAAYGFELPVALCASPGNLDAHLAAVLPYCMSMEILDPVPVEGTFTTDVRIEEGWAVAGDRPGNGLASAA
jgi:L-alanine-DL-glutamate epimerase-like enolase superfamily enzyme